MVLLPFFSFIVLSYDKKRRFQIYFVKWLAVVGGSVSLVDIFLLQDKFVGKVVLSDSIYVRFVTGSIIRDIRAYNEHQALKRDRYCLHRYFQSIGDLLQQWGSNGFFLLQPGDIYLRPSFGKPGMTVGMLMGIRNVCVKEGKVQKV